MRSPLTASAFGFLATVINLPIYPKQSTGSHQAFFLFDFVSLNCYGKCFFLIGILNSSSATSIILSKKMNFLSLKTYRFSREAFYFSNSFTFASSSISFCYGDLLMALSDLFSQSKLPNFSIPVFMVALP
ncbi:MAG: hypothetical protein ACJAT1_002179 [Marivirga sp.]